MSVYLNDPKAICLGEMGLDFNRNFSSKEEQILCFESQLSLANSINKPLFLHQRDAHEEFLSILDNYKFNQKLIVHCFTGNLSELEKKAEKSSRQVTQQLICFFLKDKVGNVMPARVVGVTHFGVFCELEGFFVSGLMHVTDLEDDHYVYSERNNILKGKRSGKTFKIGDQFNVRIDAVIPEERKIILYKK